MKSPNLSRYLLSLLFLFIGVLIGVSWPQTQEKVANSAIVKYSYLLGSAFSLKTTSGEIFIYQDNESITANFTGEDQNRGSLRLTKQKVPELFSNKLSGFIHHSWFQDKASKSVFLLFKNSMFDHGGITDNYAIVVSPNDGWKVVYSTPEYFFQDAVLPQVSVLDDGTIYLESIKHKYSFCYQCGFTVKEFVAFDEYFKSFKPVNNKFKKEFEKLLTEYENIEARGCEHDKVEMPFAEIVDNAGLDARCNDEVLRNKQYISMREYYQLKEKLKSVIAGSTSSFLD